MKVDVMSVITAHEFDPSGYCNSCGGWMVSPNGCTPDSHTDDCAFVKTLAAIAELIAAVEGLKFDKREATTPELIAHFGKRDIIVVDVDTLSRLVAALLACKGQDHER